MATDQSLPRHRLILIVAVVTSVILFMLKFGFDSYFTAMMEGEAKAKIAPAAELQALRAEEQKKLTQGPAVPIEQAMKQLAQGRTGAALIEPQPSTDDAPMIGWGKSERALAAAATPETPAPATGDGGGAPKDIDPNVHSAMGDGGTAIGVSDGGVPRTADGGSAPGPHGPSAPQGRAPHTSEHAH